MTPFTSKVVDSLFVGETENIGNPRRPTRKRPAGRSLPKPDLPDFPIRGYEYYDYRHDVVNTTFRNFEDNATRKTGAISNLLFTSFGVSTNNAFEKVKFENAKPVYFPPMGGNAKWASDNGGSSVPARPRRSGTWTVRCGAGPNLRHHPRRRERQHRGRHAGLRDQAHLERRGLQGRRRSPDRWRRRWRWRWRWWPRWRRWRGQVLAQGAGWPAAPARAGAPGPGAGGPGGPGAGAPPALVPVVLRWRWPWRSGSGACRWRSRRSRCWCSWPGALGGRAGGAGGGAPAQPPVILSRNGKEYTNVTATNVRAGTEIKVTTERPSVNLSVAELDAGSWVIFQLPGFNTAAAGAAADQPGCAAQRQRNLVLQGQGCDLGEAGLPGDPAPAPLAAERACWSAVKR